MFVLFKVLLFFFRPIVWIVALFMIAFIVKNPKRRWLFFKTGFILLVVFSNPFIIRQLLTAYEAKAVELKRGETYPAGIVLGGFVTYNSKEDKGYFNPAADRFIQTALLYKQGHIRKIIVAAGNGYITKNNFNEASFTRQHLIELGIPQQDILTDSTSRNTLENALYSKRIIDSTHIQGTFLLISSAMHLPRAKQVFIKQSIPVKLYPCDFSSKNVGNNLLEDYLVPSGLALSKWDQFIKELAGIVTYKITGKG